MNERFTGLVLPRGHVELKAMPGAGDDAPGKLPFAERPSLVRAHAVEGMKRAFDVEQGHDAIAGNVFPSRSRRAILRTSESNPMGHYTAF